MVKSDHKNGVSGLQDTNFCHPGYIYGKPNRWTERFLKHFERNVVTIDCKEDGTSPAAIETAAFARYFKKACRPGSWSNNIVEDAELSKYIKIVLLRYSKISICKSNKIIFQRLNILSCANFATIRITAVSMITVRAQTTSMHHCSVLLVEDKSLMYPKAQRRTFSQTYVIFEQYFSTSQSCSW